MKTIVLFATLIWSQFAFSKPDQSQKEIAENLIHTLQRNQVSSLVAKDCITQNPPLDVGLAFQTQSSSQVEVPLDFLNWGSGSHSEVWRFDNEALNDHFKSLFKLIETCGVNVSLSRWDLFHGHIYEIKPQGGIKDILILFHGKEYPRDLARANGKGMESPFTTEDEGFRERNYLYLQSSRKIYVLSGAPTAQWKRLITQTWLWEAEEPWARELLELQLKANTFQDGVFMEFGRGLGNVNYFIEEQDIFFLTKR